MQCFTDMLNSEYHVVYDEFATATPSTYFSHSLDEEENVEVTPFPSQAVSSQKVKEKRTRTKNFTRQEDEMLISAWQNITFDNIIGVDQPNATYWERVHNYFIKYKDFESERNWSSLMHRWSTIQLAVSKFQGFYNQLDGRSGYSEDDKIRDAKEMYKDFMKCNFSVEHCWKILRYSPKWNIEYCAKKSKVSRKDDPTASSASTPECMMLENSEFERPIGRKAAKEMQRKRKRSKNEHDDNDGAAILEQMRADQLESRKQRNEHLKEMVQLAKEKVAREIERDEREKRREAHEQDEADARIMAMDTSSMGAIEVEYFNLRKQEILERRRNRS